MNAPAPLDLGYADRALPADFLQRTRQQGRAIKRRRRAGAATAGVATAALVGVLTVQFMGSPAGGRKVTDPATTTSASPAPTTMFASPTPSPTVDLSTLPYSSGTDPSARYTGTSDSTPIVWAADITGKQVLTWFRAKGRGQLCTGDRAKPSAKPGPGGCDGLAKGPVEGFWLNEVIARSETGGLDSPDPVDAHIFGLIRGPVTRVVVDLPLSGAVDAPLKAAPDGLGTQYMLTTSDFTIDGKVVGAKVNAETADDNFPLDVTVYRGDTAVFHCAELQCWNPA